MTATEALAFPRSGSAPPAWLPPRHAARPAPTGWRWLPHFATALLLLVAIGLGYLVFGPNRPNPERPADQPAVVAPATASPSATPDGTLATISLPSGELPSEVIGGFNYYSVAPGSVGTWDWTCCTGLRVDYILSGTLTIRGAGPMQVLRGDGAGSWEDVAAGNKIVLDAGDALASRMEDTFESVNAGSVPVESIGRVLFTGTRSTIPSHTASRAPKRGNSTTSLLGEPVPVSAGTR